MPKSRLHPAIDSVLVDMQRLAGALHAGQIIAYPCEGVWGLGCDPHNRQAVGRLLGLKGRSEQRGLILVGANSRQLLPYVSVCNAADGKPHESLGAATGSPPVQEAWSRALSFWPGPVTCLLPAAADCPVWISGAHLGTVAVRVSAHPPVRQLCQAFGGALVSTSANPSGQPAARNSQQVRAYFGDAVPLLMDAEIGTFEGATPILDSIANRWIRGGAESPRPLA